MGLIPLTLPQQDIYFDQLISPDLPNYNIGARVEIRGHINVDAFRKAYSALVNQQDALNYILIQQDNTAFFKEQRHKHTHLNFIDYSQEPNGVDLLKNYIDEDFKTPFDLFSNTYLFSFTLLKGSEDYFVLYTKYHHIIIDGWGTSLLFQRLITFYNEALEHKSVQSEYTYLYTKYVENDIEYQNSEDYQTDRNYWLSKYSELPDPLLPKIKNDSSSQQSQRKVLYLKRTQYDQLNAVSKKLKVSTFHTLLGILYYYFGRCNNNTDFAIGLPVLNRNKSIFKRTVGLFMGMTALRMQFDLNTSFETFVQEIRGQLRQDYRHQRFPLGKIIQGLSIFESRDQLFNITLSYEKQDYSDSFLDTKTTVIPLTHGYERVALAIYIREFDPKEDVKIDFDYNLNYFDTDSISQFSQHFEKLVDEVIKTPFGKLYELDFVTAKEKELVINTFNTTAKVYPDHTLNKLIDEQAYTSPNKIAIQDDRQSYTYEQLETLSNQIAQTIEESYANTAKFPVAVLLERSAEMVIILLGIVKSGRAYIPLDPSFPIDRLTYIIENSQVNTLICESNSLSQLTEGKNYTVLSKDTLLEQSKKQKIKHTLPDFSIDTTAYIIYTSGSTGNPKGVEISHKALVNFLSSMQSTPGISHEDTLFAVTTYSFDISILEFFLPLITGSSVYIAENKILEEPRKMIQKIQEINPDIIQATPGFYQILYSSGWTGNSNLKVLCGGDVLSDALAETMLNTNAEVWNMYGPTETTIWSSIKKIEAPEDSKNIGVPINNTTIFILDDNCTPMPIGAIGTIFIGGDGLAKGYYGNSELTDEKFVPSPFDQQKKIYNTGDLGKWKANGEIEFLGRSDNQVKIRGYRIELREIEKKLNEIPKIREAIVIAKKEEFQNAFLIGFIKFENEEIKTSEIIKILETKLPEYMIPQVMIPVEEFPLTPNKKIDRKTLAQIKISEYQVKDNSVQLPQGKTEEQLSLFWTEILDVNTIDTTSNFFALGGHSINAVTLAERINTFFNIDIGIRQVFTHPTIKQQATLVTTAKKKTNTLIPKAPEKELYDIAPVQKGLWFASQYQNTSVAYNMHAVFQVQGNLNAEHLQRSLKNMIGDHEILRTNFIEQNGVPTLKIKPRETTQFKLNEISGLTPNQVTETISEILSSDFDLKKELLLKVYVLRSVENKVFLVFITHHLIMDGHSLEIFQKELISQYNTAIKTDLPENQLQYKDYAMWSKNHIYESSAKEELKSYWQQHLKGYQYKASFKRDRNKQSFTGDKLICQIDPASNQNMMAVSRELSISKFSIILASIYGFINRYANHTDITIGIPVLGRNHRDLKTMIGMFVNTIPIRSKMISQDTFFSICKNTSTLLLDAAAYQDYPTHDIIYDLGLTGVPYDLVVVYQNPDHSIANTLDFKDFSLTPYTTDHQVSRLPVTFNFIENKENLICEVEYDKGLYDKETIQLVTKRYQKFLLEIVKDITLPVDTVDIELDIEKNLETEHINIDFNF